MKKYGIRLLTLILILAAVAIGFASCKAASKDGGAEDMNMMEAPSEAGKTEIGGLNDPSTSAGVPDGAERKIIKTFDIGSETKDFDAAISSLHTLIAEHGGYVESSTSSNKSLNNKSDSYTRYASYTVRVPAENAEAFVGSVGTLFNITSNKSYVEDISETYYSIEARLEELQVERDSLMQVLEQPETAKDYDLWLTVNQRLSEVRQQIAVYQGQINRYDSRVAYSTVNLSINEVIHFTEVSENRSFGSRLGAAFREGWSNFTVGMQDFIIWFAEALPVLLLLGAIATGVVFIIRAARKKKKKKIQ